MLTTFILVALVVGAAVGFGWYVLATEQGARLAERLTAWHVLAVSVLVACMAAMIFSGSAGYVLSCKVLTPTDPDVIAHCMAIDAGVEVDAR